MIIDLANKTANNVASLLFSYPDQAGVLASLNTFFANRGLHMMNQAALVDDQRVFVRTEWVLDERWQQESDFLQEFSEQVAVADSTISVMFNKTVQTIGVFVSHQPHVLVEVLNRLQSPAFARLECQFIISNVESLRSIADRYAVPFFCFDDSSEALAVERRQLEIVHRYKPNYIGLAHYDKTLSADFINKTDSKIIDVRHELQVSSSSADPYREAYHRGIKMIGATSRLVSASVNKGPIIEQDAIRVRAGISEQEIGELSRAVESQVFMQAVGKSVDHKVVVHKNRTIVFE